MLILGGPVRSSDHRASGHPERPERIDATLAGVADLHLGADLLLAAGRVPTDQELERVHSPAYLTELAAFCAAGGGDLDADTYAGPASFEAATRAAGAGLAAVEALEAAGAGVALVAARPPGHHATAERAMGFCLINSVAVTAAALSARGERVLIVDWDVHHGNGTQDIFWRDPSVLYASIHQWPLFPGTGRAEEVGGEDAVGYTVNVPLPPGATGDVARAALETVIGPVADAFDPTWVLISAGFDAHRADPLADLSLSSGDFAALATCVAEMVPRPGRLVLFLEGGYDADALRRSVAATLGALLGSSTGAEAATTGGPGMDAVLRATAVRRRAIGER